MSTNNTTDNCSVKNITLTFGDNPNTCEQSIQKTQNDLKNALDNLDTVIKKYETDECTKSLTEQLNGVNRNDLKTKIDNVVNNIKEEHAKHKTTSATLINAYNSLSDSLTNVIKNGTTGPSPIHGLDSIECNLTNIINEYLEQMKKIMDNTLKNSKSPREPLPNIENITVSNNNLDSINKDFNNLLNYLKKIDTELKNTYNTHLTPNINQPPRSTPTNEPYARRKGESSMPKQHTSSNPVKLTSGNPVPSVKLTSGRK